MPDVPGLLARLAVAESKIMDCLDHPDLVGIDRQAVSGTLRTLAYARDRIMGQDEPDEPKQLFWIERSLPEGDRE